MNSPPSKSAPVTIPFSLIRHTVSVPALINDSIQSGFVVDTGIGGNLISSSLCEKIRCQLTGEEFRGKRMSGQEVSAPLSKVPLISLGSFKKENVPVGVFDMNLPADFAGIDGFLSLQFFEQNPFTVDYNSGSLVIENETSILSRLERGTAVRVRLEKEGPSIDTFLQLNLPSGRTIEVEVDMGSDELVLHSRFMEQLGIPKEAEGVKKVEGKDETGNSYVRYFARIPGLISLTTNPIFYQQDPNVMFQEIIYDGLVGQSFLKHFTITYDVPNSRLIFSNS